MTAALARPSALDDADRRELLRIARVYAREWLRSGRRPPGTPHRASLLQPSAAWLRIRTERDARDGLRIAPDRPLYANLAELAVEIAARDPALRPEEISHGHIDALALGSPVRVTEPTEIEPGRHGVALIAGPRFALFTATETARSPDRHELLAELCRAAGLACDSWREAAVEIHAFEGEPFGD